MRYKLRETPTNITITMEASNIKIFKALAKKEGLSMSQLADRLISKAYSDMVREEEGKYAVKNKKD